MRFSWCFTGILSCIPILAVRTHVNCAYLSSKLSVRTLSLHILAHICRWTYIFQCFQNTFLRSCMDYLRMGLKQWVLVLLKLKLLNKHMFFTLNKQITTLCRYFTLCSCTDHDVFPTYNYKVQYCDAILHRDDNFANAVFKLGSDLPQRSFTLETYKNVNGWVWQKLKFKKSDIFL